MKYIILCIFYLFTGVSTNAFAKIEGATLSHNVIVKGFDFKGQHLLISGTRTNNEDIVIIVNGPPKSYQIVKKEREFGMLFNSERFYLPMAQAYYRISATTNPKLKTEFDIVTIPDAHTNNNFCLKAKHNKSLSEIGFCQAFYHYQTDSGLYNTAILPIKTSGHFFETKIDIPENAPLGMYNVNIYTLKTPGEVLSNTRLSLLVQNSQFYQGLADFATNHPLKYSLFAVAFAIFIGATIGLFFNGKKRGKRQKFEHPPQ